MKMIQRYKKTFAMSAVALGLLAGLTIDSSMAYFTTYVSAGGSQVVNLDAETRIHEKVSNLTKHLTLENKSARGDCFVRVKVFHGAQVGVSFFDVATNTEIVPGVSGDYWYWPEENETAAYGYECLYYRPVLPSGEMTTGLDIKIDETGLLKPGSELNDPTAEWIKDKFNVVVVQECKPAIYDADGNIPAYWTVIDQENLNDGEGAGN